MYWMPMDEHSLILASGPINQGTSNNLDTSERFTPRLLNLICVEYSTL